MKTNLLKNIYRRLRITGISIYLVATVLCGGFAYADGELAPQKRFVDRIDFFTEFYAVQDIRTFSNHKNEDFRNAYLMAAETEFEAMIISLDDFLHFGLKYRNNLGMGRQAENIVFDPQESDYSLIGFFEYRRNGIFYQVGLDHSCFHEIDRLTRPTPYWNQIYLTVSSQNYRFKQMREKFLNKGQTGWQTSLDGLRWSANIGYFVRKFGNTDPSLISGGHPWSSTLGADVGYTFYQTRNWAFSGHKQLTALIDTTGGGHWKGLIGLDADFYSRKASFGVFVNFNYEFPRELPLYSKDRLFEFGVRFR